MTKKKDDPILFDQNTRAVIVMICLCTLKLRNNDQNRLISQHNIQKFIEFISPRVLNDEIIPKLVENKIIEDVKMFKQPKNAFKIIDHEEAKMAIMSMQTDSGKKGDRLFRRLMREAEITNEALRIFLNK